MRKPKKYAVAGVSACLMLAVGATVVTAVTANAASEHQVTADLTNPWATDQARSLMRYLTDNYGKHILAGQEEPDHDWVGDQTGKMPAITGFDMMDYSPSRVEHGASSTEIEKMTDWDSRGGIVTLGWHWNAPTGLIDSEENPWWRGYRTDATTFDVAAALDNPDSEEYGLLIRDIDAIAEQLKKLNDAHIPVLWRPLQEAEGGQFWWGAKGPEAAKKLYRLMYDRFVQVHWLDNLIWVWNSSDADWYPGDDVVDIVSFNSYPEAGDHGSASTAYQRLVDLVGDKKLVAMSENGSIPDPAELQTNHADWSWFNTWYGDFISDGQHNSHDFLVSVYNSDYVLTLDELGDWKNYQGAPPTEEPPTEEPPTSEPPTEEPPTSEPPTEEPPTSEPPTEEPPTSEPPTSEPPTPSGCTAQYRLLSQWQGGFIVEVTVRNVSSAPISGWKVHWAFTDGQRVANGWSAVYSDGGGAVTASNMPWNGNVAPGGTAVFGFLGSASGSNNVPAVTCASS